MILTYSELVKLPTFEERYDYLKLNGRIGEDTFGYTRYLNQIFYKSKEWKEIRNRVILRDNGCDLGVEGYEIPGRVYIHHINPITERDILDRTEYLLSPEYLICVSYETHNAIHYGSLVPREPDVIVRRPYDTCPWKTGQ